MENLYTGILTIVICGVLVVSSFLLFKKEHTSVALVLLLLSGFVLRFYTSCDWYLHEWDERYHALVAKNMMLFPFKPMLYANPLLPFDVHSWSSNHIWLHKLPIPLWCMALSMKIFGVNELALRLPSMLLSTIAIFLIYRIGTDLFNKKIGFISAFLLSINGLIIELSAGRVPTDHVDVFFMFFVLASFYFIVQHYKKASHCMLALAGILMGLAILSKWLPAIILLPMILILNWGRQKNIQLALQVLVFTSFACITAIPWVLYINHYFPEEAAIESGHRLQHFFKVLDEQGGTFLFHFIKATAVVHEFVWVALLFSILVAFKIGSRKIYTLLVWLLIPYLFFSFSQTKMQAYLLFCVPAAFMLLAYFYQNVIVNLEFNTYFKKILIICFFFLPIRYCIERTKCFQQREREPNWAKQLKQLNNLPPNTVLFNEPHAIEAMFYTNAVAYSYTPNQHVIDSLKVEGYNIVIR